MKWKNRNLRELAHIICGDAAPSEVSYFRYGSSMFITEFFEDCDLDFVHDGSTRRACVSARLEEVLALPHSGPSVPPDAFIRIIRAVLDKGEAQKDDPDRSKALAALNVVSPVKAGKRSTTRAGSVNFGIYPPTTSPNSRILIAP